MMKPLITLLVLAAIGQAADSKPPPANETTDLNTSNKRELFEGNFGLRNGLSYETKFGARPEIEYSNGVKEKSHEHIFSGRVPQISKISDVLTGQGGPFEVAVANHLYSPVSVYQARLSSPTIFDVPSEAQSRYPEHKFYKQNQKYFQQYEQNALNPQNNEPKPGYSPVYSREESKLLHLETAFPRLQQSYSTPAPLHQNTFIDPLPNLDSHLYPQFSYQHVEQIPYHYPDGSIKPVQYYQHSLVKLIPMQSESDDEATQDNKQTERPQVVQDSKQAHDQEHRAQIQGIASYANFYRSQSYAPSQHYISVPQSDHLQPQDEYQLISLQQSTPSPQGEVVQIPQRADQYQQYLQTEQSSPRAEIESQQVVHIRQTTPRYDHDHQSTQETQESLSTQPELETLTTEQPDQPLTISTLKPFSEYSTTPKLLELEEPTTIVAPYTTHKPISRMPMVPLRPLPGCRRLPLPRPFSNIQPTTVAPTRLPPLPPLPAFRRFLHLNTRQPTSPNPLSTFSSLSTIATTPQPELTEILSTQPLPITAAVSRSPIIRIRHKPSYNQFQSTTPQPTRPDVTTLGTLSQPTSTYQPPTTLEPETQSDQTLKSQELDNQAQGPEYLPASELPPRQQPGGIYHLQSQPQLAPSSPQSELEHYLHPFQIQPSPRPQLQFYPQPSPPPQSYPQPVLIQPSPPPYPQNFLPPGQIQLYQLPVFNLRPQYQPLSTPPPLQPTKLHQPEPTQSQLQPRPDAQEPEKFKSLAPKSKLLRTDGTYLNPGAIVNPIQSILHPHHYSQTHEVFIQPNFHHPAAPTFPSVQYFGKYAEAIFGHYHH